MIAAERSSQLDILLDLTRIGLPNPLNVAPETWHFSYGPGDLRDPARAAVLDYVRTPGHSKVALISEPKARILREGTLFWSRGEQLDRILFDPADWPAIVARDRLERMGLATSPAVPPGATAGSAGIEPSARIDWPECLAPS